MAKPEKMQADLGFISTTLLDDYEEPQHLLGDNDVDEQLAKLLKDVQKGYQDSIERADQLQDYWDIYNCKLNDRQFYAGNSKVYLPLVHNAVNARKTRFVNQMFPASKRHVEVLSTDGDLPEHTLSVAEHYINTGKLRTEIMPALMVQGDVEGQYSLYVSWKSWERKLTRRIKAPINPNSGEALGTDTEVIATELVKDGCPDVEILNDNDLLVLPMTAESVDDALAQGGSVSIIRRWSKAKTQTMADNGDIDEDAAEELLEAFKTGASPDKIGRRNRKKAQVEGMGTKVSGKEIEVYETWSMVKIKEDKDQKSPSAPKKKKRRAKYKLCQSFMRTDGRMLGCRENPYWNGRCPVISVPVNKVAGSFKGDSKVKFCADVQYAATDSINIAMDSASYSMLPIVMTDPERNPRVASMILSLAAIWEVDPRTTQFVEFPKLWEQGFSIAMQARDIIMQQLSVTPAAITQGASKKKPSQADIANEQQVDILTTADAVSILEEGILSPLVRWFIDLDYQYRDRDLMVKKYGPMGVLANMDMVEPLQMNDRYEFRWLGVEAARNAQQIQQQISAMNVLRGIPPQMYGGYKLDLGPAIAQMVEASFGPRLAPLTFKPMKDQLSMPAAQENMMLMEGFDVPISPMDNHQEHLMEHMKVLAESQDPKGVVRVHMEKHKQALVEAQKAMQQQMSGQPGGPGGAGPGTPGQPKPGAQQQGPRGKAQAPAGAMPAQTMNTARGGREPRGNNV